MTTEQLTLEFEDSRGQLKSFLLRITACVEDAEDIVQDTFIKALEKLNTFRGESSLKTWLFSIATNLAKDNLRAQKRWTENVTDICKAEAMGNQSFFKEAMQLRMTSPQGQFEAKEHIAFCFTCISKSLPLEQQLCIFLKEVYDFKVNEITTILNTTEAMVKYYLHTGRSKMINIFEGRCALINKEGVCHQCSELNGIYNPKQNTQEELMKIALVKEAESGNKEHLFDLRMQILSEIDPFTSKASELQLHHLEHNRQVMEKYLEKKVGLAYRFVFAHPSKEKQNKMKPLKTILLIMATTAAMAQKAKTTKTTFHRETSVSTEIKADAKIIWALLTTASDYTRWNSTVTSLEGNIKLGEKIKLKSYLDAKRTFKLKIKEFDVDKKLVWGDGQGNRIYTLTNNGNGTVTFSMTEKIGGLMFPMYAKMIPPFDEAFEKFAADLKKESETIMNSK